TCPYTPQQNGVAERKNRHLLEVVRASLFDAQMPRSFWGEAVCSAVYLINRVPSSVLNFQTPLQALRQLCALHSTPNLEPRVFGCVTFVHLYTYQRNKLEPRALKCVFIGYAQHQKGYRCYHPPTQKLYITMDALMDPNWKQAMNDEMQALQKNSTWELVPLPSGKRTVGCRWIYTIKLKADGSIERYKARLVAKGYTQRYGVDYQETFAPVAKINTVRILISLAANLDWPLHQFDVKNAFLHGDLEEEVYMDPPPGCKLSSESKHYVCKLKKSLYGLKQSPRAWFGRLTKSMRAFGYKQSNFDHTLFLKHKENKITALIVYVDDMIVTGDDPDERKALQEYLSKEFEMKDLGTLKYFLGIEVSRSHQGIFFQFMHSPSEVHRDAVNRILRYLKSTPGKGLMYSKQGHLDVIGKKQNVVARSSAEAEYRGMAHGVCELLWIKHVLTELGFKPKKPMKLYCDNIAAINIAHNPVQHDRT
ncbi:unnamed protein product, partial [Prunus brigantina]